MFYAAQLVSRDGPLQVLWVAATLDRQLNRQLVDGTAISKVVDVYLKPESKIGVFSAGPAAQASGASRRHKGARGPHPSGTGDAGGDGAAPLALRLSGQLLLGVCRIYSRKVVYLLQDCERALLFLRNICPEDVPLAFGEEQEEEPGWGEGEAGTGQLAGSKDHDAAEGEGRKSKSRKRATAAGLAGLGGASGMTDDGLAPLVLPYDEDEILLAGSSQSRRTHEAEGHNAADEGTTGGAGRLLGRLGSGFGSGALDDYLGTPGAGSQDPWATPWGVGGGRGTDEGVGLGTPGADYFDDAVPEHFEFDLDEDELEGLRLASQSGTAAQVLGKEKEQHAEGLQDNAVQTPPRRRAEERPNLDPHGAAAAAAPDADSALTEPRQVLPQWGEDDDVQPSNVEDPEPEERGAGEEEDRLPGEEPPAAAVQAAAAAAGLAAGTPDALGDGPLANEPQATELQTAVARRSSRKAALSPGAGEAAPATGGASPGSQPCAPTSSRPAPAPHARVTLDVAQPSNPRADAARAATTLPTLAVRNLLQDRSGLIDHDRRNAARRRASGTSAAVAAAAALVGAAAACYASDATEPSAHSAASPWMTVWARMAGAEGARGLQGVRRGSNGAARGIYGGMNAGPEAPAVNAASRSAASSPISRAGQRPLQLLDLATGPITMPLAALAPPLQRLFKLLAQGGKEQATAASNAGAVGSPSGAPPAKRARRSRAETVTDAEPRQQQPLDTVGARGTSPSPTTTSSGGQAAGATAGGSAGPSAQPGSTVDEDMPPLDLDMAMDLGLDAADDGGVTAADRAAMELVQPAGGLAARADQDEQQHVDYQVHEDEEELEEVQEQEQAGNEEDEELEIEDDDGGQQSAHPRKAASDGFTARTRAVLRRLQALAAGARRALNKQGQPSSKRPRTSQGNDGPVQVTTASALLQLVAHIADPSAASTRPAGGAAPVDGTPPAPCATAPGAPSAMGGGSGAGGVGCVSRMAAARTFYDLLVLTNRGYISLAPGNSAVEALDVRGRSPRSAAAAAAGAMGGAVPTCASAGDELVVIARRRLDEQPAAKGAARPR
ncbi:hypothetical protein HXX76_009463 [Chlamydomonas incerta]|uniref:Rad21/Rec8-like protein N-terminal domain-containing protein n=1 Tax=Chlamydomonas incerta TaxID=51695 RepID=A0A835SWX8_CHLIN|nr:hypothetical protein HXX76_009463 [Chlamydomonas incerta]|eukprot:KAG2431448.1 hypothetical protein HXX76_009463 [Chlamydomonas incerta]